ncbi:MAG: segregation/condensation protein A [Planctomycetes bacterium]|nr:segregation/condensation protein A [Planctomycetota bacterium]MBU1518907.1 segregation/condensation protein A [Planctomycetota bacterium]MBU2457516.1 segregation/condensation protein A [Planctomycetota bacterium]
MSEYRINLDIFSGPLDLLLYLVRKEEVDIYDIPLAKITEEYIRHVEMLKLFDIELAGEFLVMAATLMEIKSAMLLPKDQLDAIEQGITDPRGELIRQLLEYKKFKDAANMFKTSAENQQQKFSRSDNIISNLEPKTEPELDLDQISVWDLLGAFDAMMKATGSLMDISHIIDDTPIDLYQIEVLHRLQSEGAMSFTRVFEGKKNKLVMIGLFLAVLELVREKLITAEQAPGGQAKPQMPIYLRALTEEPAEQAVHNAMLARWDEEEVLQGSAERQNIPIESIEAIPAEPEVKIPIAEIDDNRPAEVQKEQIKQSEVQNSDF